MTIMVARSAPKMEARSGPKMEAGSVPKMEAHNAPKMETHSAPITGVPMGAPNVFFVNKEKSFGHPLVRVLAHHFMTIL